MINIGIITGSTRPGRVNKQVADWILEEASKRGSEQYTLIDILDFNLPLLDEPKPASSGEYTKEHTRKWAAAIAPMDAFIFVTPEYNHGMSAALKNALDFLYKEWNNKAAGIVSYGGDAGVRAVEQLRLTLSTLMIAHVKQQVSFSLRADFENGATFKPGDHHKKSLANMLDQVAQWGNAMTKLRTG